MNKPRIVIVGSGFGGLFAAKALKRTDAEITLISDTSHHLFQPLLYQVATGILSEGTIAPSTRDVLAGQRNVMVVPGRVHTVDLAKRCLHATSEGIEHTHEYDYLIVAAGAGQNYFGNDRFAEHAPGMKSVDDALELRARIFGAFEQAELAALQGRHDDVERLLTFVVVGAGPTGVEMAGQIAELSRTTLRKEFRNIDPEHTTVHLVDAAPAVLGQFGEYLSGKAQEKLEKLGVQVSLSTMVSDVAADGVTMKGTDGDRHITCATTVWAAGVSASPLAQHLAEQSGAETDRSGRILPEADLSLPGQRNVFVVGDMVGGQNNPGVAPHAIQGAEYVAERIRRSIAGKDLSDEPFQYRDKGSMATISRFGAIVSVGKLKLHGFTAWLAWLVLHLLYIIGFKNQATTILSWCVTFIGNSRGERTHTSQQASARSALVALEGCCPPGGVQSVEPTENSATMHVKQDTTPTVEGHQRDETADSVAAD